MRSDLKLAGVQIVVWPNMLGELEVETDPYGIDPMLPDGGDTLITDEQAYWITTKGPKVRDGAHIEGRIYEPLREPVNREFTEMPLTYEGVQAFANEYGFLGRNIQTLTRDLSEFWHGESTKEWLVHAIRVRIVYLLWDSAHSIDGLAILRKVVKIDRYSAEINRRELQVILGDLQLEIPLVEADVRPLRGNAEVRLRRAAIRLAETLLNELLEEGVRSGVHLGSKSLHLIPYDLLGAICILTAEELLGRALPLRRCPCGKWFKPSRIDQQHHEAACRVRAMRARRKQKNDA